MPMDIRMFFAKKGEKKKEKKDKNSETAAAPPSKKKSKVVPEEDAPLPKKSAAEPKKVTSAETAKSRPKKKKRVIIDDSDDGDEEWKEEPETAPSPPKKRKSDAAASNKKSDRTEISASSFFASTSNKKKQTAPRKSAPRSKKEGDNTGDTIDLTTDAQDEANGDKANGTATQKTETSTTTTTEPKVEASSPVKKKRSSHSKANDKQSPPASNKKSRKSPSSAKGKKSAPKRDPPLKPTMKLDSFNVDNAMSECMLGYTFVFTGVLPNLARESAQDLIKTLGGRVTGTVSSKTDYLIVGEILEDGRPYQEGSKYKRAVQEGTLLVMGEEALYGLAQQFDDKARAAAPPPPSEPNNTSNLKAPPPSSAAAKASAAAAAPKQTVNPYARASGTVNPYARVNPYAKKPSPEKPASSSLDQKPAAKPVTNQQVDAHALWVDRYKPTTSKEILGNQDAVRKLGNWLTRWEHTFNNSRAIGKTFSSPNGPWKAALLSGPPGIGKTTTAILVAKESGRDVLEFNASDVRSKKALQEGVGDMTGSHTIEFNKTKGQARTKRCIIMDEVDGMGAGDRSGMAELIQMIKNSRVPIICICNDRQAQKIKSLLPYCMDLRYRRPVKSVIAARAMDIAKKQGLTVERNAAEAIAESCGNDVRQVINCLQMWAANHENETKMTYKGLKERERSINKDEILRVSLFDAARLILEGRRGVVGEAANTERDHFFKRNDAFFVDYNFVGLLVQQNYLKVMQGQFGEAKRKKDQKEVLNVLERMHSAAESMSDYALAEGALRGNQNWSLLPFSGMLTVKTGYHAGGETGGFLPGFPEFTSWLGKNSSRGKKTRLLRELKHHMNYKVTGGTEQLRMSYLPVFRDRFMSLLSNDEGGVEGAIELMDEYGLDRDDVFEKLDEFRMNTKSKRFADFDSKKKAAFTRTYNAMAHKSQALVDEQGGVKKLKRKASSTVQEGEAADLDAINDDKVVEEEEDDDELDAEKIKALFKRKGRKAATGKKNTKAKKKR